MSKLIFIALIAGFVYLVFFNKPKQHSIEELSGWFDSQLQRISENLETDIELDRQGKYPHDGKQTFDSRGHITYHLLDKRYSRFELPESSDFNVTHIKASPAWNDLESTTHRLGLELQLDEVMVDGDDVQSYAELDEYIHDIPRYYTVTVTGW